MASVLGRGSLPAASRRSSRCHQGALQQPVPRAMQKIPGVGCRWQNSGNSTSPSRLVPLPFPGVTRGPNCHPVGGLAPARAPGIRCHAAAAPAKGLEEEEGLGVIASDGQLANYADHLRYRRAWLARQKVAATRRCTCTACCMPCVR